jgi:hypothetical protein
MFASAFYEGLAAGRAVDLALAEARREVNLRGEEGEIEWATPVLYMRGDGDLFSFEEREPVQPEATSVAPRIAAPAPGTGAVPTAEHDPGPKVELAKTQLEEAGKKEEPAKKPSRKPRPSTWKILVSPFIVMGAVALGLILIKTPEQKSETTPAAGPVADATAPKPVPAPVAPPEAERKVLTEGPRPLPADPTPSVSTPKMSDEFAGTYRLVQGQTMKSDGSPFFPEHPVIKGKLVIEALGEGTYLPGGSHVKRAWDSAMGFYRKISDRAQAGRIRCYWDKRRNRL